MLQNGEMQENPEKSIFLKKREINARAVINPR
jgi:hypothetical protein